MCLEDYRRLARALKAPTMFTDVIPLIVKQDEVELLLSMSEKERSIIELSRLVNLSQDAVKSRVLGLFKRGFLRKRLSDDVYYSAKSFRRIIDRHLSEGRLGQLGRYVAVLADYQMEEHVKRGKNNPYPEAKVLPTPEAVLEPKSIVLPYETAVGILENARSFSIRNCDCRMTYDNCDNPLRVCLGLNEFSDELVERGIAEKISLEETKDVLKSASKHGLVHQALYTDWLKGEVFDICSCCTCCCTYLRTFMNYGIKHHIAKSGLVARAELDKCDGCGICLERCVFNARKLENGKSIVIREDCYGCGLCTTTCSLKAIELVSETAYPPPNL
ncbi:MAG: ATP-binding protein [Candidatus Hodarchaeota archaeon]